MGRKRRVEAKKKKGGILMGMRSGIKKAAKTVAGEEGEEKPDAEDRSAKIKKFLNNALTVALVIALVVVLARRCGFVKF